jgi:hypothetical protein
MIMPCKNHARKMIPFIFVPTLTFWLKIDYVEFSKKCKIVVKMEKN